RFPNTVQLLSYGNPLLDDLLVSVEGPPGSDDPKGIGLTRSRGVTPLSLFVRPDAGGARAIQTLPDLRASMSEIADCWSAPAVEAADAMFRSARTDAARRQEMVADDRRKREAL